MTTHTTLSVQQQASTYNHPCGDLLDRGSRREYLDIVVPLHRASIEGDLEAAKVTLKGREHLVRYSITENKDTPLHVAAAGHSTKLVSYLVNMMSKVDLELQNRDGNTAFCLAVIAGNVKMVKIMAEKNRALLTICGSENMMPLYHAAFHGNHEMVTFLYDQSKGCAHDNMDGVLLKCIQANIFDVALRILEDQEEIPKDEHVWDMLQVLAQKPGAFSVITRPIIVKMIIAFQRIIFSMCRRDLEVSNATLLLRLLLKRVMEKPKDIIDKILRGPMLKFNNIETYPSQILFIAAQRNNVQFLVELIREYPDLICKRNDDDQTIFHIAVSHRHHNIYSLINEIGSMKDLITPITDVQGNNILHLVGKNPKKNAYDKSWVAAPFQLLSEFLWYKEVEDVLPPPYREVKNASGQTAQEVFVENHKDLVSEAMKSINDTINLSMVVSALVCTVGFSIVFSVPGGFDQNNGLPIFLRNQYFILFILMDAFSFIFSTMSIILFLSFILPSPQENTESLLKRWVAGQVALMTSVSFIIVAFVISFFLLYRNLYKSTLPYVIYAGAFIINMVYAAIYFPLLVNVFSVILGNRHLFRPRKRMLYQKKQ